MNWRQNLVLLLNMVVFAALAQSYQFSRLSVRDGLPNNQINCIYKDRQGFMWIGTIAGLSRYDGYQFKNYQYETADSNSLSDNDVISIMEGPDNRSWVQTRSGIQIYDPQFDRFDREIWDNLREYGIGEDAIRTIKKDSKGRFWFTSNKTGLYCYEPRSRRSFFIGKNKGQKAISASPIIDLGEDPSGNIWLIHANGILENIDGRLFSLKFRTSILPYTLKKESDSFHMYIDRSGTLWIYDNQTISGIITFNSLSKKFKLLSRASAPVKLSSNIISGITEDKSGNIWIASDHGGINVIDKKRANIKYVANAERDDKSLSQNNLSTIYCDNIGSIWIGTFKRGINLYHPGIAKFETIRPSQFFTQHEYNDVNDINEDPDGNLWIATNGKGLVHYNRKTNVFKSFSHQYSNPKSLSHDAVSSLYRDKSGQLWVGTYSGGLDRFDGRGFTHFRNDPSNPSSLSDNRLSEMYEDSFGRFWIATMGGGINLLDKKSFRFKQITAKSNQINSDYVFCILEDSKRNIWFGTGYGISILSRGSSKFNSILHQSANLNSLVNNSVNTIKEDKNGYVWIGTREGLSIYDPRTKRFCNFTAKQGLPHNNVHEIQFDNANYAWISTSNGLARVNIFEAGETELHFENFDERDGLQGNEFSRNASLKLRTGELVFGGTDGINIFYPSKIKTLNNAGHPRITDLQLFNQSVKVDELVGGKAILSKSVSLTKELIFKSDQNVFTLEFASLNYLEPHKVKHQYMMEGFDSKWILSDNSNRKATYTNLDPGNYVFKVRISDTGGRFNTKPVELRIRILPPFYKSPPAYFLYAFIALGLLYLIRQRGIKKLKMQFAAEQERREVQQMIETEKQETHRLIEHERIEGMRVRELDALKIKFLTNISHEFRTPLSLILAPLEKMGQLLSESEDGQNQVSMLKRNARRLLNLVNQLLDFRRLELKELSLQKRSGDVVEFVKEISFSFKDIAEQKQIFLSFTSSVDKLTSIFDYDKLERILFNILSNAFKFTLENGKINVSVDLSETREAVEIRIRDTGIGIARELREKIFENFFQTNLPDSILNQGSGIGLAIAREFARLHGGDITLESENNLGSCFVIILPLEDKALHSLEEDQPGDVFVEEMVSRALIDEGGFKVAGDKPLARKPTVLIVEDDNDFRFYLKDNLKGEFNVIEAGNGKDGWRKALFYHPNLVVSDISMPEMNGIELSKKIKQDNRTGHIPLILLTAMDDPEQQLLGLESGANDYMTKPFSFEVLLSKMRNILQQQESFRLTYQKQFEIIPSEIVSESPDELFFKEVVEILEKNVSNRNFSVDELSSLLYISRGTAYKRILTVTGKTPLEFIRSYRLKRAAQLLETGNYTVSQVCYKVGFKTPKHFVKLFKAEYGVIPSKYADSVVEGNT